MRRTSVVILLFLVATTALAAPKKKTTSRAKPGPCHVSLADCPPRGCAAAKSPDALPNQLKDRSVTDGSTARLTFDDFAALQQEADALVGEKQPLSGAARATLKDLPVSSGKVSEGDLVEVVGFIIGVPHSNTSESVNCRLHGVDNNDFHIPLGREANADETEGIVVEMIPQNRPDGWDLGKLKDVESQEWPVLVRGQLLYDNKHHVNADPQNLKQGDPKRFSLFEIHPITAFLTCETEPCDPDDATRWVRLEDFTPQ